MEGTFYDEIEIEDMDFDADAGVYTYPCPCGDKFAISTVGIIQPRGHPNSGSGGGLALLLMPTLYLCSGRAGGRGRCSQVSLLLTNDPGYLRSRSLFVRRPRVFQSAGTDGLTAVSTVRRVLIIAPRVDWLKLSQARMRI